MSTAPFAPVVEWRLTPPGECGLMTPSFMTLA
jgi:hypothetical protein